MRKLSFLLCLVACMAATNLFAQIQIVSGGTTKAESEVIKASGYISWRGDGYYFKVQDYVCSKYDRTGDKYSVFTYLGKTVDEVKQSGMIVEQWFKEAKNDDFLTVSNPDGRHVCIYKYNSNIYFSYGDVLDCKNTRIRFGFDVTRKIAGEPTTSDEERSSMETGLSKGTYGLTGYCSFKNGFLKSIKNFK